MERFRVILLRQVDDYGRGSVLLAMSGGEGFNGRWLVWSPPTAAGTWLVPYVDADVALTVREAARVLTVRRGHNVPDNVVRRYIEKGTLKHATRLGTRKGDPWVMSRHEVWTFKFPKAGRPWHKEKGRETHDDRTEG